MTRLIDHLPALYQDIKDFRELSKTVTAEYDKLDTAFEQVEDDQFVKTSSEYGVARREKEFSIIPDKTIENLDFRKRRLLSRMQNKLPYVDKYLNELLEGMLGDNMHHLYLDTLLLEMDVLIELEGISFYNEVQKIIERIVPLNVSYKIYSKMQVNIMVSTISLTGEETTIYPYTPEDIELKTNVHRATGLYTQEIFEIKAEGV